MQKTRKFPGEGIGFNRVIAGVLLFVMTAGVVPAEALTGFGENLDASRSVFDYQFDRADREATPERWRETAREGLSFAVSAWERYSAELFSDAAAFAAAREEMIEWSEEELQRRYAEYLAGQFFLAQSAKMRDETRKAVRGANLELLYEHDEAGDVQIDEQSGDPVIKYQPESLAEDILAWREKTGAGITLEYLYPELAAYLGENGVSEALDQTMGLYTVTIRQGLTNEINRELAREETLFIAKRTLDVYSLRGRSEGEAAGVISREIIAETEYIVAQGIASLEERINALSGGAEDLSLGGEEWLEAYRVQFERGLQAWEDAEERFFVRRIEWEQDAGQRYQEGEAAWAEAFYTLQTEQQKWAVKAEELFRAGEQLFINAEAELRESIRLAKEEFDRDALERREAGSARAGAYLEMYITSGTVASAAVENIRFWAEGMGKEGYPSAGSAAFDTWVKNELAGELAALEGEFRKIKEPQYIRVERWFYWEQIENPRYFAEVRRNNELLAALQVLKPAVINSVNVKAALQAFLANVLVETDECGSLVEAMIGRMDRYREMELWSDLYKTYMAKAVEARNSLQNDFDLVIGKNAGLLVDVLNDAFSSEDFFLDEYQIELIRAEAVKNYWEKRHAIAEAVADYANLFTGDRATAGDLASDWEKARADYEGALALYREAQSRLTEEGAEILAAKEALNEASAALNEANAKLNTLYTEHGELMAAYMADDSSFFAREFSGFYQSLIENNKTIKATGEEAVYTSYLEHAARYYDLAALDGASALLKEIVTEWEGGRKEQALALLSATSLEDWYYGALGITPSPEDRERFYDVAIRDRLEREKEEKRKAAILEKTKMAEGEAYDAGLIAELDAAVTTLGAMIEALDYAGSLSNAVLKFNGERAVRNLRQLYAGLGLTMEGYLLPSPRETASSLFYAQGDPVENIAGFLTALDGEISALPGFLSGEAQSWKAAFTDYLAAKIKDSVLNPVIDQVGVISAIEADLEKIKAAEKINGFIAEQDTESARYLCAAIDLGVALSPFSIDDLKNEAAKRIAAELGMLYTEEERQEASGIKDHLGQYRERYAYADDDIWAASLERAAERIIERENIRSFDGLTTYDREHTFGGYEKEALDSRLFLEESGLVESDSSFYALIPELAGLIIETMSPADPADPPLAPDFTGIKEVLSAWKDKYGALFVIPSRFLIYTVAGQLEDATDVEALLAALELDACEGAEEIWAKTRREDFDLTDSVLSFTDNGQTAGEIAESIVLARLKYFAFTGDNAGFEAELAAREVSGAVIEIAQLFKDTIDKGARYYGYDVSGDLFTWALKMQAGDVEKAAELADLITFQNWGDGFITGVTGNEGGQKDYFSAMIQTAAGGYAETLQKEINKNQNVLSIAAALKAIEEKRQVLVDGGKQHWRYYITEPVTESNNIFKNYNNGVTEEEKKLKPGTTDAADEPSDEMKGAATMLKGFLADAFERLDFEERKLNDAFLYYDTVKDRNALAAYAETARLYLTEAERVWTDDDLKPADYQYTELYQNAASDLNGYFYTQDFLQGELLKNGAGIILAKESKAEKELLVQKKLMEITGQRAQYAELLGDMNKAAASFEEAGKTYEAYYQLSKEAFVTMEERRFEYEKQDAIKRWASTAYLASGGEDAPSETEYRDPAAELAYSGERLRNADAALDALAGLYNGGETARAYQDKEYQELYEKYKMSFSRMMTAIKTSAALNKAIAEETVRNQNLYSDYLDSLYELTGGINHTANFGKPETQDEYNTVNQFITVENGKLTFHFANANRFEIILTDENDVSSLTEFLTPKEADKKDERTKNETNNVSAFELSARELTERLAARYTDSAGFKTMTLAREYLIRKITEDSGNGAFAKSSLPRYQRDQTAVSEHGGLGRMYTDSRNKVYESAGSNYAWFEAEQKKVWDSLGKEEQEDIEFWTILTLLGDTVSGSFSRTDALVYEALRDSLQSKQNYYSRTGNAMLAAGALALAIPWTIGHGVMLMAIGFSLRYEYDMGRETMSRLRTQSAEYAKIVGETQNTVTGNFTAIAGKLNAYHKSCDRLATLIGEA
ncbi:MAG: hypothetical protein LBG27_04885, partial [Spirochaetaceae bacterium]|nr:hypothetical protein [Spirochaetaceae bacterium]